MSGSSFLYRIGFQVDCDFWYVRCNFCGLKFLFRYKNKTFIFVRAFRVAYRFIGNSLILGVGAFIFIDA
nr:hypothetical protein BN993_03516 [Virgibacillus halodenitrificans]